MDVVQNVNMNCRPNVCDTTLLIKEFGIESSFQFRLTNKNFISYKKSCCEIISHNFDNVCHSCDFKYHNMISFLITT